MWPLKEKENIQLAEIISPIASCRNASLQFSYKHKLLWNWLMSNFSTSFVANVQFFLTNQLAFFSQKKIYADDLLISARESFIINYFGSSTIVVDSSTSAWWQKDGTFLLDPLGRPVIPVGSDHYFHTCCSSVRPFIHFKISQIKQLIMIATSGTVGLDEGIIDGTFLILALPVKAITLIVFYLLIHLADP